MKKITASIAGILTLATAAPAQGIDSVAGRRTVFLGDSITAAGHYIGFMAYYLNRLHPDKDFDIIGLGLGSETLSGLSEQGHAGGKFPRPSLFERLGRVLEKAEPEVVFACYGINDGIYLPLDETRFTAFREGVTRFIGQCKAAGVKQVFLITPPIHDSRPGESPTYDGVMAAYASWEMSLDVPGVRVIDLHTAMRKARDARDAPFSKDRVHPDRDGHLLMAKTILGALGIKIPDETLKAIDADPLYGKVNSLQELRSSAWMKHIGYIREKTVAPQPLGDTETRAADIQREIDALRRPGS
jgi:lysophospholipase L1-like esterase